MAKKPLTPHQRAFIEQAKAKLDRMEKEFFPNRKKFIEEDTRTEREKNIEMLTYLRDMFREAADRQKARGNFPDFIKRFSPFKAAKHQRYLIRKLNNFSKPNGPDRMMVFMPPGHGKSYYTSLFFPMFYLAKNPSHNVILISHNNDMAEHFSRKAKALFQSDKYKISFDLETEQGADAARRWRTNHGGEFFAAGVGASVTGRRADLIIIDDPISGHKKAGSHAEREKLWQWYLSDLRTRMKPNAKIVVVQTRWHEDDLSGRLLEHSRGSDYERWEQIRLPALAEKNDPLGRKEGEALWPRWFRKEALLHEKKMQTPRMWNALYQQSPLSDEGDYFDEKTIHYYDPDKIDRGSLKYYGASDYAVTEDGGDYTVHGVFGVDQHHNLYVMDWWRGQVPSNQSVDKWLDLAEEWKVLRWGEEKGQIIKSLGPFMNQRQMERAIYTDRIQLASDASKEVRARSIQARMQMGKVFFPKQAAWSQDLFIEMLKFPNGKHDDQVDVLSLMGRMIDQLVKPKASAKPLPKSPIGAHISHHLKQQKQINQEFW